MIRVLEDKPDYPTAAAFVADLNKARLANRKAWIVYVGTVQGVAVEIKTYDCGYLQIFRVNGLDAGGAMDMKPTGWKETIRETIERNTA